jgi:hypothetical protein
MGAKAGFAKENHTCKTPRQTSASASGGEIVAPPRLEYAGTKTSGDTTNL